ncbi:MAG: PGF-CTERM protein, partial [Halobacteriales archaeon]
GAKFANASTFADMMAETYDYSVRSVVSQPEDGSQATYVRVEGLTGDDPTESDIRSLEIADDDTEIKLPGEWDREFPSMDMTSAAEFLGVEPPEDSESSNSDSSDSESSDDDSSDSSSTTSGSETETTQTTAGSDEDGSSGMPGFGLGVGLVALLASLALISRRRSE